MRSSHAGRQRQRRILGWLTRFLIVAALGTGLYFGARKAISWVILKNPEYNVAELDVQTDGILEAEQVLQTADLHKGSNIFLVNLNRAKTRIESIPEVEHVQVSRQLPNRITVQINERKPVAWLSTARGIDTRDEVVASKDSFLIDAQRGAPATAQALAAGPLSADHPSLRRHDARGRRANRRRRDQGRARIDPRAPGFARRRAFPDPGDRSWRNTTVCW